jgi:chromosome segregation ATPase
MTNAITLDEANRAIRAAQSELERLNLQHASASEELRLAESEKQRRRSTDEPAVFARSVRECNAAQAECERIEALITTAQGELDRTLAAAREPRKQAAAELQQRLDATAGELAGHADVILKSAATILVAREAMERLRVQAQASTGQLRQVAGDLCTYRIPPEIDRAAEVGWLTALVRPERLQSIENRTALAAHERALRGTSDDASAAANAEARV